jgi:hypothetical protein
VGDGNYLNGYIQEVAIVRTLKLGCKTTVLDWHRQNSNKILNKEWFAPVLDGALRKYSLDCSVVHGFLACGLNPWNPENNDYLECLGEKTKHKCTVQKP